MTGGVWDGLAEGRELSARFDYVIVGSGAAGATAARILADTGRSVVVVEEGPAVKTQDFKELLYPAFRKMFRAMGATIAVGRTYIPIIQGAVLGGSTVMNSAIMWRIPDDVWAGWRDDYGLGEALPLDRLHEQWDQVEEELHVHPVERAAWGRNNTIMHDAAQALGVSAHAIRRGDRGCVGSANCLTGCPYGAKQSMLVSYLPYAFDKGVQAVTSARVDKVEHKGGKATAVVGRFAELNGRGSGPRFRIEASRGVLICCSAIQTPQVLQASGIRNRHLGEHFQAHPGSPIAAVFDEPTDLWFGATQGFDLDEFRQSGRYKIETIATPPEITLSRYPGVGKHFVENMMKVRHAAVWGVQLRSWAHGRIRKRPFGPPAISYDLLDRDMVNLREAMKFSARAFFAAGAKEVELHAYGMPHSITADQLSLLDDLPLDPAAYPWILSHLFGTARMAKDAKDGVVDTNFQVHGTQGLYVLDSSVFPTNLGVNPQQPIMGVAMYGARRIAEATA